MNKTLFLAIFLALYASAEVPIQDRSLEVNDKKFFEKTPAPSAVTSTSPKTGTIRNYAEPADYTAEQRAEAIIECEPTKETQGLEAYRNCFKSKIRQKTKKVKDAIEDVDIRQQRGLKKTPTLFKGGISPSSED